MRLIGALLFSFILCSCGGNSEKSINNKNDEYDTTWIYQFYHKDPQNLAEQEENDIIDYIVDREIRAGKIPRGIYYVIEEEGKGPTLRPNEAISIHYKGYFLDGTVFDSSYARGTPLKRKIGEFISGWNIGLTRFQSGSKGKIFIPSRFAYGAKGLEGVVPPNTVLIFEVDILY